MRGVRIGDAAQLLAFVIDQVRRATDAVAAVITVQRVGRESHVSPKFVPSIDQVRPASLPTNERSKQISGARHEPRRAA